MEVSGKMPVVVVGDSHGGAVDDDSGRNRRAEQRAEAAVGMAASVFWILTSVWSVAIAVIFQRSSPET